jgi:hypothetical protein
MSMGLVDRTASASSPRIRHHAVAALLLLPLALTGLVGCRGGEPPAPPEVAETVQQQLARTLHQRASALEEHRKDRFLESLAPQDRRFAGEQQVYYDNLARLPVAQAAFDLDEATITPDGEDYWAEVLVRLQLDGYDVAPVTTRDRFRFSPTGTGGRYLVSSTTDAGWESDRRPQQQPWDIGPIVVREDGGVLGIFDRGTVAHASAVLEAANYGRYDVATVVPDVEVGDVVVYALSEPRYVEGLRGLSATDPERLDAATVPVLQNAEKGDQVASYRIMLNPRVLDEDLRILDRLMRHELTHVMLGGRADGAPLWLTEGLAEYVSVQPTVPAARQLPTGALTLARGQVDGLPDDATMMGSEAEAWYGVAWWLCEYVVASSGEAYLWRLLDALADGGDAERVVADELGLTPEQLADRAMRLMVQRYDPPPPPPPASPPPPSSPPPSGSASPSTPSPSSGSPSGSEASTGSTVGGSPTGRSASGR